MKTNHSFTRFLMIWLGQLLSGLGTGMTTFALGVHVYSQYSSVRLFAMIALCGFLPSIILRPVGGVLADRIDRRIMIALGDLGSGAGVLFILFSFYTGEAELWKIYAGLAVNSAFTGLQSPSYKAAATDLLSKEQYSQAGGLMQLSSAAQHLISPFAAAMILSFSSIHTVLIIDIATFFTAISAALLCPSSLRPAGQGSYNGFLGELHSGWKTIMKNTAVIKISVIMTLVTFCVGFLQTLLGPMILSFSDAANLGRILSASAFGMVFMSIVISMKKASHSQTFILISSLFFSGTFLCITGLRPNSYLITAGCFLFFCTLPFLNTSAEVIIRELIPNKVQGKAWAFIGFVTQTGYVAAYLLAGFAADTVFTKLLLEDGILAPTLGRIIGTGPGRGSALLIILAGCGILLSAMFARRSLKAVNTEETRLQAECN